MLDFMMEDAWRGQWWNVHCPNQFESKSNRLEEME